MAQVPNTLSRVKTLFGEVVDLPEEQREKFLQDRCGDDSDLRSAVMSLLQSHDRATNFLDRPTILPQLSRQVNEALPRTLGPYRLTAVVGEGGFGTVYTAEQDQPVRRTVAVKVLKPGMDSRQILSRFDAERDALAMMDHPNIARVLDAGTTDDGRPYFVMELVAGVPVTQYCDEHQLGARERLELFIPICQAVQHAHQKGVIHRDIKPSNVLVAEREGQAVPKVIDFGVAKAIAGRSQVQVTAVTEVLQLIGTPEYMSPEQAAGDGIDIDTRSDVYSLGVLLYELMTGATPFDSRTLRSAAMAEMQRVIREVEPPRPSTRLSVAGEGEAIASRRGTQIARLRGQIRGDVDWIVMKCLEKDRSRRYESAAALAGDLANHLSDRPVAAGPPSRAYVVSKFVRRHRAPLAMACAVAVALLVGFVGTAVAWRQARVAQARAEQALASEAEAREVAEQHVQFVQNMFRSIRPEVAQGRTVGVREILDDATARVQGAFKDRPLAEAAVRQTFGVAYSGLGMFERAREQYDLALQLATTPGIAPDRSWLINLQVHRAAVLSELGQNDQAEMVVREAIASGTAELGPDHPTTLSAMDRLANILFDRNRLSEAEAVRKELQVRLDAAPQIEGPIALAHAGNYASLLQGLGRWDEAEALFRRELARATKVLGEEHPDVIGLEANFAGLLRDRFRFAEALELSSRALTKCRRVFGEDHPNTLRAAHAAALLMSANGRSAEALSLLRDTIARARRVLGEDHRTTLFTRHNLTQVLAVTGQKEEAERELVDIVERVRRSLGEDHRDTLMMRADMAQLLQQRQNYAGAEEIFRDVAGRLEATVGVDHYFTVSVRMRLGLVLGYQDKLGEAEAILAQVYAQKRRNGETKNEWTAAMGYGVVLAKLGKYEQALPILHEAEAAIKTYRRLDRVSMRNVALGLALAYDGTGQPEKAAQYRQVEQDMAASLRTPASQPAGGVTQ